MGTNAEVTYAYNGLTSTVTDPQGRHTTSVKDTQGRTIQVIDHLGQNLFFAFDAAGNMTSTTDHAGNVTTITYDLLGRKTGMIDPDTGRWGYAYNAFGEIVIQQDFDKDVNGNDFVVHTVETLCDLAGRVLSTTEAEATNNYTYDTAPRGSNVWLGKLARTTRTKTGESTPYYVSEPAYDALGRVSSGSVEIEGETHVSSTTYDALGRPETVTYPKTGFRLRNVYNASGALEEIKRDDNDYTTRYWKAEDYNADGALTSYLLGNGIRTERDYYQKQDGWKKSAPALAAEPAYRTSVIRGIK